jgi:hypothetical protein
MSNSDLLALRILARRPGLRGYAIMSTIEAWSGDVFRASEGSLSTGWRRLAGFARKMAGGESGVEDGVICRFGRAWQMYSAAID